MGKLRAQFNRASAQDGAKVGSLFPIIYSDDPVDVSPLQNSGDLVGALQYNGTKWQRERELRAVIYYNLYYLSEMVPALGEGLPIPIWELIDQVIIPPHATKDWVDNLDARIADSSLRHRVVNSALTVEDIRACGI